jgi:hypothetical protein
VRRLLVLMAVALGVASAYLKAFDVGPTRYSLSGTMDGRPVYGGVGETFIAQFDSAAEVDVFIGEVDNPRGKRDTSHISGFRQGRYNFTRFHDAGL